MAREPDKSTRETERAKSRAGTKNGGADESADPKSGPSNAVELLKAQHSDLQATLAKGSDVNADRPAIVKEFAAAWLAHSAVEQEILVPALKDGRVDEEKMAAVAIQRDIINLILADLLQNESDEFAQAKLEALAKQFAALVEGADGEDGLFARVSSAEKSIPGLNSQMKARYARLKQHFANMDESLGEAMVMLAPQRLSVTPSSRQNRREYEMNRYSNVRDRDEQGRFVSDDDRRYSRGGSERDEYGRFMSESGSRSRGRYEDDDDDNRRYSRGGPERDEHGRFMSEGGPRFRGRYDDEDERYSRRSMGRERDDEGRFTRRGGAYEGRGHGGWFGDAEGHSEASRRGWDSPRHGESGWYGDPEGHSEASRRGWENPRHGESGWYGDPEGHSEASRRGREHEGNYRGRSSRYDEMPSRSRSRYDDDYERGNGGRGHGGWSGDPEGHSEASRRGWQNRR